MRPVKFPISLRIYADRSETSLGLHVPKERFLKLRLTIECMYTDEEQK